ncbi:MAG: Choline-sulfatase [Verrucomicrobiota bacterium]|jgi:iduronate 2-sulfatase
MKARFFSWMGLALPLAASSSPNVLFIAVDDLKPLLGCYGDPVVQTPHIDRLASRGVRFERAYANQAVCAPSRNALLTGLRPESIGVYDLGTFFRRAVPDAITLPQRFKQAGYRVAALGKIYHPYHGNSDDVASWSEPSWHPRGGLFAHKLPDGAPRPITEAAEVPDSTYGDGMIADEAIRRLRQVAETPDAPFFLAVGFLKPHLPFAAPRKYWDLYRRGQFSLPARIEPPDAAPSLAETDWGELRRYAGVPAEGPLPEEMQLELIHGYHAAVSFVDAQVGRLLDALDETGLAAKTVIVLWGDHGFHLGDHGFWCKHTNYEQAARMPLIISIAGARPGVARSFIEGVDVYPTLCELAGISPPAGLDGTSQAAVVRDPQMLVRTFATHVYPRGEVIGRAVRTEQYRLVEWRVPGAASDTAEIELYDYDADPAETRNIAADNPAIVLQLRALIESLPPARPQI